MTLSELHEFIEATLAQEHRDRFVGQFIRGLALSRSGPSEFRKALLGEMDDVRLGAH
jgi:hypothetical protein